MGRSVSRHTDRGGAESNEAADLIMSAPDERPGGKQAREAVISGLLKYFYRKILLRGIYQPHLPTTPIAQDT